MFHTTFIFFGIYLGIRWIQFSKWLPSYPYFTNHLFFTDLRNSLAYIKFFLSIWVHFCIFYSNSLVFSLCALLLHCFRHCGFIMLYCLFGSVPFTAVWFFFFFPQIFFLGSPSCLLVDITFGVKIALHL